MSNKRFSISDYSSIFFFFLLLIGIIVAYFGFTNEDFRKTLPGNYTIILGYLGLIILTYDLSAKREMQKEELERKRKMHEEELAFKRKVQEEERNYRKMLHEEELCERNEQRKFDKLQQEGLKQISNSIAEKVSNKLQKDTNWAIEALERAKLGIRGKSLFADRLNHFREEKEQIAREFTPILLERCKNLILEHGKKVFLVIDSGTTLYPFFEHLARLTVRLKQNGEAWLENVTIVTNNLSGLETLIETGRINPNNRYSDLAIQCHLLPGMPLPIYSAVIGEKTEEALKNLRKSALEENDNPIFIGLITGNWIRVRRSIPICPIPLARGDGHLGFKNILVDNSDEVFVISPLGKIFLEVGPDELNEALRLNIENKDPDSQPYKEVLIEDDKATNIKLISTKRYHHNVLFRHSTRIADIISDKVVPLNDSDSFIRNNIENVPHILFPFDYKQENINLEIEKEFPHSSTRNAEFIKKFFRYPES